MGGSCIRILRGKRIACLLYAINLQLTCRVLFQFFFIVFRKHCLRSVYFTQTNGSETYIIRRLIAIMLGNITSGNLK